MIRRLLELAPSGRVREARERGASSLSGLPPRMARPDASSFPCSPAVTTSGPLREAASRAEEFAMILDFFARALAPRLELSGLPHLKFLTQADKRNLRG